MLWARARRGMLCLATDGSQLIQVAVAPLKVYWTRVIRNRVELEVFVLRVEVKAEAELEAKVSRQGVLIG